MSRYPLRLRVHLQERDLLRFPREDEALGASLLGSLRAALERGLPRPVLVVLHPDRVERFDLRSALAEGLPAQTFIAAAAGQPGVEAVAVLGVVELRHRGRPVGRAAVVFVEWPDNRWWHAFRRLDGAPSGPADGDFRIARAVDGAPRPAGLGGWFSRARYFRLRLEPAEPPEPEAHPEVH